MCYFAYPEDHRKSDIGYDDKNRFGRQTRRVAMELVFVYTPSEGLLEAVLSGGQDQKAAIIGAFCEHILGLDTVPEMARRGQQLSGLKDRKTVFATDAADNIQRVLVRQLRFDLPGGGGRRITVSARPRADDRHVLYDLLDDAINQIKMPLDSLVVSQAKISVYFRGERGRKGKTLTFDITAPDSCNLKDHGHDLIVKKYLKRWGLAT